MRRRYIFSEKTGSSDPHCVWGGYVQKQFIRLRGAEQFKKNGMVVWQGSIGTSAHAPYYFEKGLDSLKKARSLAVKF